MIVWINGAYGVGKSTIAAALVKHRPGALLYDPEPLGYFLRDLVRPAERSQDYQELAIFAPVVIEVARQLHMTYGRDLVMSLGVWQPGQAAQIREGLEQIDQVRHYTLTASRSTINKRLMYRGDGQQAMRWIHERLDDAIESLSSPAFSVQIPTDNLAPSQVIERIIESESNH